MIDIRVRILFLQPQPCIRASKYAQGLKRVLGDGVSLIFGYLYYTLNELYGYGDEFFDSFIKMDGNNADKEIKDLVRRFNPDIIHSHNAPDTLTISATRVVDDVPVIHDVHEALSLRETGYYVRDGCEEIAKYREYEKMANEQADGRIYVSEGVRDHIQKSYGVDPRKDLVFPNYVSKLVAPRLFEEKLSERDGQIHIVYAGTVSDQQDDHYNFLETFREMAGRGVNIHIYVVREHQAYKNLAEGNHFIHYHGHRDQNTLLQEMTRYDFGWLGLNTKKNRQHIEVAFPNKTLEYLLCGLPILSFPHRTIKNFIEENGVGMVFNDLNELSYQLKNLDIAQIRMKVLRSRTRFTMEGNIGKLLRYYETIRRKRSC